MKKPVRILLANSQALIRGAMRALLEKSPAMQIVAEVTDTPELLRMARLRKPDVVVMDADLHDGDGLDATSRLHQQLHPRIPVVIVSMSNNGVGAAKAFEASASGYLLTRAKPGELCQAIRRVTRGSLYIDPSIARSELARGTGSCSGRAAARVPLTRRQRETLTWIANGKNTKEIAALLGVSSKTIDFHRRHLMKRLNTHSIGGLVHEAIRLGLVKVSSALLG